MNVLVWLGFTILLVCVITLVARSRRRTCTWTAETASARFWQGIICILIVQVGGFLVLAATNQSIGILGFLQWPGIYWIAMSVYRKQDLRAGSEDEFFVHTPRVQQAIGPYARPIEVRQSSATDHSGYLAALEKQAAELKARLEALLTSKERAMIETELWDVQDKIRRYKEWKRS